jgi:DNA-binding cell septation regulator SpoVG
VEDLTLLNLQAVHKGALKAIVSIRLVRGLMIHDCKILQQDGRLSAKLPQRSERLKGGEVVYPDLVEFTDPQTWPAMAPRLVADYQSANAGAHESVAAAPAPPKREGKTAPKQSAQKTISGKKRSLGGFCTAYSDLKFI